MKKKCPCLHISNRGFVKQAILLVLLAVVVSGFLINRGLASLRWGMSECLRWQVKSLSERFIIAEEANSKLVGMVEGFAQKIDAGSISPMKGFAVLRAFYKGPLTLALLHSSIMNRVKSDAAGTDLLSVEKTSLQFFSGSKAGKIAATDQDEVQGLLMEKRIVETPSALGLAIPEPVETFRKKIGQTALHACLARMEQISLSAGQTAGQAVLDPVIELQVVLSASAGNR